MHYHPRNKLKQYYYSLIREQITKAKIKGQYRTHSVVFYKNPLCDAPNIVSIIEKVALDGLQYCKVTEEDNVKYYTGGSWEVGGQDKDNPRIELYIQGVE